MRFLIYIWTQIFLMGIGGIAGAISGVRLGDQAGMMLGAGIGGVIGIIVARYLLSYAGANSHSPNKESEPAAHVHDALYAQVGEEVANKDFHPGPMAEPSRNHKGIVIWYMRFTSDFELRNCVVRHNERQQPPNLQLKKGRSPLGTHSLLSPLCSQSFLWFR